MSSGSHVVSSVLNTLGSICRFLIKDYQPDQGRYEWRYITLCSVWFQKRKTDTTATRIHLCFGLPPKMRSSVTVQFKGAYDAQASLCPFEGHSILIGAIIELYDHIVWGFRKPVRGFEKVSQRISGRVCHVLIGDVIFPGKRHEHKFYKRSPRQSRSCRSG